MRIILGFFFVWVLISVAERGLVRSARADDVASPQNCKNLVITRTEQRRRGMADPKTNDNAKQTAKEFYPDIDDDVLETCLKNSHHILFIKQDVDAQHKRVKNEKTLAGRTYEYFSIVIIIFGSLASLLLGMQRLHPSLTYFALFFTTLGTATAAINQLENPRETFIRGANTEYALARLQGEIDDAIIEAAQGDHEIRKETLKQWRESLRSILAESQGQITQSKNPDLSNRSVIAQPTQPTRDQTKPQ